MIYNRALSEEKVRADYEVGLNSPAKSLTGTVTGPDSAGIAGANVTLATLEGAEINTTQIGSTGHYAFADVSPGFYDINATKRSYWSNTNNVTVTPKPQKPRT